MSKTNFKGDIMSFLKMSLIFYVTIHTAFSYAEVGFVSGNTYNSQAYISNIVVFCQNPRDGRRVKYHTCRQDKLTPIPKSFFKNDSGIIAKKVRLISTFENGQVRHQSKKWNSKKGMSKKKFNLWKASFFKRPLISHGENNIHYQMLSKSKEVVEDGYFSVFVTKKKEILCPSRTFNAYNTNDCFYSDRFCQQAFRSDFGCR